VLQLVVQAKGGVHERRRGCSREERAAGEAAAEGMQDKGSSGLGRARGGWGAVKAAGCRQQRRHCQQPQAAETSGPSSRRSVCSMRYMSTLFCAMRRTLRLYSFLLVV